MSKASLNKYITTQSGHSGIASSGPYLTISRELGCGGTELASSLQKKLHESEAGEWQVYEKEILKKLAEESGLSEKTIDRERLSKPGILKDIIKNLNPNSCPDSHEIRKQIAILVREAAIKGYVIIVGQGGAAATSDLENGLSVRIEAPFDWRVAKIAKREKIDKDHASKLIEKKDKQRKHLGIIYNQMNPRIPAFDIVYDCSHFSTNQIADQIIYAMRLKGMIPPAK